MFPLVFSPFPPFILSTLASFGPVAPLLLCCALSLRVVVILVVVVVVAVFLPCLLLLSLNFSFFFEMKTDELAS